MLPLRTSIHITAIFCICGLLVAIGYTSIERRLLHKTVATIAVLSNKPEGLMPLQHDTENKTTTGRNSLFAPLRRSDRQDSSFKSGNDDSLDQYLLIGTIINSDRKFCRAIIAAKNDKSQHLYAPGDSLAGGTIVDIRRNEADIRINGRTLTLTVEHTFVAQVAPPKKKIQRKEISISKDTVASIYANASKLLPSVRIEPYINNDTTEGYTIKRLANNSIFYRYGLRNNDIIKEVNGVPLTDISEISRQYERLKESSRVEVTVQRNGQPVVLHYDIR